MSVKNLHDTISDLMASSSSASKRSKTIESIKNRLIEWPESVDDYSRLLLGLMAVGGSGRTTNLSQCLCAIDTLVGDLSKCVPPNLLEGDTYSAIQKLSKKIIEFSIQLLPVLASHEGAVEYMCKLVKTLSGGLFPLTFESSFPAGLVVGLLQVPIKRPRQEDLIKASVWSVVENFNSDLTLSDVSTLLSQSLSLFQRSDKTNDMVFAVQFTLWTLQRAPLLVRNFATGYPQIVQDIFEILCGLVPLLPEKVVDCLGLLCVVMLSLGSSVSFDVNNWDEILSVLSEQRVRVTKFSDFFFKLIDLSVDILLLKTGSFKAALDLPECENDEHLQTRLVERWSCLDQFKDYFFVENKIENSIMKNFLLLTSALVNKLVTPPGTSVPMHFSALFIPNQPRGDKVPISRGGEAVMHRLKKLVLTQIFVNSKPEIGPLTCALTLAENNLVTDPQIESSFPNWISNIDKHDTNACFVAIRLVPYFQRSFSSLENIVFALSSSVEPKHLYNFIMNLVGVVPRWNFEISLLERLRDALCFRPVPTAAHSSTGSAFQQRKATSFVARLVKRAIDSNNDPDALCHLLAVYVVIGGPCEACFLTQGLSAASKGPASKAFFLLKKALIEATELLHPIVLCQCSLHTDSMGEPRSLLSQDPLSVASVMGGELRKSASIALEECIVGTKFLVKKKLQRLDSLPVEEMLRVAEDLEDVGSRIEILIHLTGKKCILNFSQFVAKLALIISKTDVGNESSLLSFLAEAVFSQSGGAFTALVASREIIPVLLATYSPPDVVRDILAVPTGGALHLSAALSPHVSRIERIALLTRIFQQTDDALYMIDQLRVAIPLREVKRIVAALVAACDEKYSVPQEFIDFIAAELQIEDLVEGLAGGVAMRLLHGEDGWKEDVKGVHSPLDVLLLSLELREISSTSGKNDPILAIQSVVRLSERPWFMLYVAHLHPDETCEYVSALIGPSSCKKQRICDGEKMDWIRFLEVCDRKNNRKIDVKNLLFASVYCVTYTDLSLHVPLMYAMQALVSDVGIVAEVIRFFLGPDAMLPDAFRNQSLSFSWKREYPVTPVCRLVVELLEKCANFQDAEMNILSALKSVAAVSERIAESVFPFLLFLFAESMEIAGIINEGITWKCCSAISEALIIAKQIEFVFSKSSESIAIPDSRCKITNLLQRINLSLLSDQLLLDPYSFGESNFHAYYFSSLFFHQPCSSLFSKPCGSLPRVLQALTQIGVEINSFTLSFHPSIRGTVSRLRKDYLSLLYEEDASHVSFGMTALGLSKGDGDKNDLTPTTTGSEELLDHLQRLISQPASVLSHNACQAIYDLLKEKSSFPPRTHDKHNETILKLVEYLRKSNMTHNARIIADWSISETLTDTTCPAIRLGLFYSLSKILWSLSLFPEATQVLTNLTVSEEISRTDIPAVASMAPRIYSRAALWVGQRRVESLEAIRSRYFAKAVRSGVDLKNEIKAKMRFVRVIDPSIVSSTPSGEIVEQFTLLCEILVSGVVSSGKSVWFASRLVSLWFTFPNPTTPVVAKFRKGLAACESLLPFFYQIAGRIGRSGNENENLEFRKELLLFIIDCAKIHTAVCLPPILQLTGNANKNKNAQTVERSKQAEMIVEKLRSVFPTLVDSMKAAFRFYLNLAMAPIVEVGSGGTSTRPASKNKRLVNEIEGFKEYASFFSNENCPVLTSAVSMVKTIHPEFAVAESGRSLPKILTVIDFEGKHHKQIVKGNDDLRNDAVLQQLFSLLDAVITTSKMRSYKVVPITASAGIAEWVSNTVTLGGYLVGFPSEESGAHMRYHPGQITPSGFKAKMVNTRQQQKKTPEAAALFNEYKSLTESFSPAMRFFFYEHFPTPKSWFHAQTCFAHSVAATSIVGFIVGLGDRHPNNILIDLKTGEVVHIDYGICFDAGRQLKIPEIVPFRLTRDMVDGLGCLGTQGPFSKTCEDVLIGLKNNSALVTAVVEVFVVDPLFNWAVASLGSDNAHSALQGVKRKLQGFLDDADVLPLTPAAQVDRLIRMATEPRYLCQMFAGWQPWL